MFELSEQFFVDLGFEKMTQKFWEKSVIEKHKDNRSMVWYVMLFLGIAFYSITQFN